MLGLYHNSIKIGIGQSNTELDFVWVCQALVGSKLGACLFHDKLSPIGRRHLFGASQELAIQRQGFRSGGRYDHESMILCEVPKVAGIFVYAKEFHTSTFCGDCHDGSRREILRFFVRA
jgi:hypothetical protein